MSWLRRSPLAAITSVGGFVFLFSLFGGCSSSGGDDGTGGSSSGTPNTGGAVGSGGMATTSSSSSSGTPIECTNHTTLNETNCSLLKQDCKGLGEMCVPDGEFTACVKETGVKGSGAACSGNKECAAGLACVFFVCAPFCCPADAQSYCGSAKCNVSINYGAKVAFTCNFSKTCTLFGNDCPENQQCRLGDATQELALCAPRSDTPAAEGEPCEFLNDCGANQNCQGGACRYNCLNADWQSKQPGQGGCPMGQACSPISPTYGTCAL